MKYLSILLSQFLILVTLTVLAKAGDNENYKYIAPSELSFGLSDFSYTIAISLKGPIPVEPISGEITTFSCGGHKIELDSNKVENGFIVTKDYGKIKIRVGPSDYGHFSIWLTPTQKKALKALVSKEKK